MSHRVPNLVVGVLEESKIYQNLVYFTRIRDCTWMESNCEELVILKKMNIQYAVMK